MAQSHIGTDILNNKNSIEIPFEYINGLIVVEANYGSIFEFNLIFDTGATNNILFDKIYSDLLLYKYTDTINIYGADFLRKIDAYITRDVPIKLHKSFSVKRDFIVLDNYEQHLERILGKDVHGILGGEFIKGLITTIDYNKKKIILYDPNHYHPSIPSIPIKVINKKPYIIADIYIDNSHVRELMLLDSGSSLPLLVRSDQLSLTDSTNNSNYLGVGLGGELYGTTQKLDSIRFGNKIYQNINFTNQIFPDSIPISIHTETGIIGSAILDNYKITIDYLRMRLYLEDSNQENRRIDKSGLIIQTHHSDFNKYKISFVEKNSPADKAGLQKGDYILRYKWTPPLFLTLNTLRKKLSGKNGKKIKMKIQRGNEKFNVSFKLDLGFKQK